MDLREHADLIDNVVPFAGRFQLLGEDIKELLAHIDDAVRHRLDIALPLFEQLRCI